MTREQKRWPRDTFDCSEVKPASREQKQYLRDLADRARAMGKVVAGGRCGEVFEDWLDSISVQDAAEEIDQARADLGL